MFYQFIFIYLFQFLQKQFWQSKTVRMFSKYTIKRRSKLQLRLMDEAYRNFQSRFLTNHNIAWNRSENLERVCWSCKMFKRYRPNESSKGSVEFLQCCGRLRCFYSRLKTEHLTEELTWKKKNEVLSVDWFSHSIQLNSSWIWMNFRQAQK